MKRFMIQEGEYQRVLVSTEADPNWVIISEVDLSELEPPNYQAFMDACDVPPKGNGLFQALLYLDAVHPFRPFRITDALPYLIRGAENPDNLKPDDLRTLNAIYQQYIYRPGAEYVLGQEESDVLEALIVRFKIFQNVDLDNLATP